MWENNITRMNMISHGRKEIRQGSRKELDSKEHEEVKLMVFGGLEGLFVVVKKLHHSSLVP